MGTDIRHISKSTIIYLLKNENFTAAVREMKINTLFHSELLVMDDWTSKFYHDLNPKERKIRIELHEKYAFDSSSNFINDNDFKDLKSLSEALLSLVNNPSWIDIFIVIDRLKIVITPDESGRFELIREKCIDALIDFFEHR